MSTVVSFTDRLQHKEQLHLELVTGQDAKGQDSYAVLLLPANRVDELRRALASRNIALEDFGRVLARGTGHQPPESLIEDLRLLLSTAE